MTATKKWSVGAEGEGTTEETSFLIEDEKGKAQGEAFTRHAAQLMAAAPELLDMVWRLLNGYTYATDAQGLQNDKGVLRLVRQAQTLIQKIAA